MTPRLRLALAAVIALAVLVWHLPAPARETAAPETAPLPVPRPGTTSPNSS